MSLDTLISKRVKKKKEDGEGYMVLMSVSDRDQRPEFYAIPPDTKKGTSLLFGNYYEYTFKEHRVLICAVPQSVQMKSGEKEKHYATYKAGFHIWKNKQDAIERLNWMRIILLNGPGQCILCRVHYRKAYVSGLIDGASVVVAKVISLQHVEEID